MYWNWQSSWGMLVRLPKSAVYLAIQFTGIGN
ncbi:UNVERIFIED_CONTAM: hypothetical protein GTU68_025824 [Idotea baltica]|nr:hypothetical protein [Idotea baltica]